MEASNGDETPSWEDMVQQLVAFQRANGHLHVLQPEYPLLFKWIWQQHLMCKEYMNRSSFNYYRWRTRQLQRILPGDEPHLQEPLPFNHYSDSDSETYYKVVRLHSIGFDIFNYPETSQQRFDEQLLALRASKLVDSDLTPLSLFPLLIAKLGKFKWYSEAFYLLKAMNGPLIANASRQHDETLFARTLLDHCISEFVETGGRPKKSRIDAIRNEFITSSRKKLKNHHNKEEVSKDDLMEEVGRQNGVEPLISDSITADAHHHDEGVDDEDEKDDEDHGYMYSDGDIESDSLVKK